MLGLGRNYQPVHSLRWPRYGLAVLRAKFNRLHPHRPAWLDQLLWAGSRIAGRMGVQVRKDRIISRLRWYYAYEKERWEKARQAKKWSSLTRREKLIGWLIIAGFILMTVYAILYPGG